MTFFIMAAFVFVIIALPRLIRAQTQTAYEMLPTAWRWVEASPSEFRLLDEQDRVRARVSRSDSYDTWRSSVCGGRNERPAPIMRATVSALKDAGLPEPTEAP